MPPVRNLVKLVNNSNKLIADLSEDERRALFYGEATIFTVRKLLAASIPLKDIIDADMLVNKQELLDEGINPNEVRVTLNPASPGSALAIPPFHLLLLDYDDFKMVQGNNEAFYLLFAHELTHHLQYLSGRLSFEEALLEKEKHGTHASRPAEIEAFQWEARQAIKFGWTRHQYEEYVRRLYPEASIPGVHRDVEIRQRTRATSPLFGRRPVRVREHRRRR